LGLIKWKRRRLLKFKILTAQLHIVNEWIKKDISIVETITK